MILCVKGFAPQVQGTYALQKAEELFERESGYSLQVATSPNPQVPRDVSRQTREQGALIFSTRLCVGQTYHALLDSRKQQGLRFNEAEVTQLLLQILPVLEYIHSLV
jgi:serine/threonine-protein kinase